jgi:hypothetical protein
MNPSLYRRFRWGNRAMTAWINLLGGLRLTDAYTCYKLIERKLFMDMSLASRGFEMEAEICMKLALGGIPIVEAPIRYQPRRVEEGKKINWKDAVRGAWTALKIKSCNCSPPSSGPSGHLRISGSAAPGAASSASGPPGGEGK